MYILKLLSLPQIALLLLTLFLIGYIIFLDKEGGFKNKFLNFGPEPDNADASTFIGIKIDNWTKVSMLYTVGFMSSLMSSYYDSVMDTTIHTYTYNAAVNKVPYTKQLTYLVEFIEPFLSKILWIIQLYMNLMMELQYIIPQFIGSYVASLPFIFQMLSTKKYKT